MSPALSLHIIGVHYMNQRCSAKEKFHMNQRCRGIGKENCGELMHGKIKVFLKRFDTVKI